MNKENKFVLAIAAVLFICFCVVANIEKKRDKHDIEVYHNLYPDSIRVLTIKGDTATIYSNKFIVIDKYKKLK